MTLIDIAREGARQANGQFGVQDNTLPEASLSIGEALASLAVSTIRLEAPIGAVTASASLNPDTGQLEFSHYTDRRGLPITSDAREEIDDAFNGASVEAFAAEYDVTERVTSGERWFDVDLDD